MDKVGQATTILHEVLKSVGMPHDELAYKALLELADFLRREGNFAEYKPHVLRDGIRLDAKVCRKIGF